MADRMHPYPMFSQNLTPNSLQQSQIPQQPPQSQQPDPQMISALSNPEHSRMWQQMSQFQNPYRPQQSNDLVASQINHQMQEFARGQAFSHGQGQPIVQQIQQSFASHAQRTSPPGPVFHDPQSNQPLIPSNFSNVPMNTQMKAAFNMNPMMHAAMSNPGISRQLKVLNQQEMARLQQSGLGVQHAPNQPTAVDMFSSPSMRSSPDQIHGSPHPAPQPVGPLGSNQGMVPGNQQPTVQKRMITPAEFQERKNYLLSLISQSENNLASLLQTVRNTNPIDPHLQQKVAQLRAELTARRDVYTKFVNTFGAMVSQMTNGMSPSTMSHLNPMVHSTPQQPPQATVSNPQVQPGFITQANQPVPAPYKFPTGNGTSPMPAQTRGVLNQQIPIQPTPIGRPNAIPPRTGGTPHQISGGSLPNTMSPNLGNFGTPGGPKAADETRQSAAVMPLPLDKQRFETTYAQFCRSQDITAGLRVPIGDNRMVDLHQLHVHVVREGGAASVTQRDMWAVIGGRLNFIQFPGNNTEPARCGPGIAQQLQNTYEQLLQHFENAYILTVKNGPTTGSLPQSIHQNSLAVSNNATAGISSNPTEMPPNPSRPLLNQQRIAAALRYVFVNAQDMRAQRVPEHMIAFVERNRPDLMKLYQQQVQLIAKRNAEQEQQNMANSQGPLPNIHEQASIGLQPGIQRPPQPIGANPMAGITGESKMASGSLVPDNVAAAPQRQPPTQDQMQHAMMVISQIRQTFQHLSLSGMAPQHVPDEQRLEYNQLLEQVYKMTVDLDGKLPMYLAVIKNEELLRKYVAIVLTVARQRQLLSTSSPQFIISPGTLRNMQLQIHRLNEQFENCWRVMKTSAVTAAANSQQHVPLTSTPARLNPTSLPVPPMQNLPTLQSNGRSASITPQQSLPPQSHIQPPLPQSHSQANQTHPHQQPMPQQIKKSFQSSIPPSPSAPPPSSTLASPTPPPVAATASSSTPATSAPTPQPSTSSPQTPKSPPSKAAPKAKAPSRVNRKPSAASKGPATPEMVPSVAGIKRPPEEDVAALAIVAPSEAEVSNAPSPKKAKTEWDGEASEELLKKQQEIDSIKTDEDTAAFFDRMKELFAMNASTSSEINHDIASTLNQILAGMAQEPADAAATAAALSVHGAGDAGPPPTALSPHMGPANDAFLLEFIDFSSFTNLDDEDNDSKAPTPDLVPSSETNPSPESGSEGDSLGSTGSPDKTKMDEPSDPLRLGSLREIDGGESAYYQAGDWKWEGPMPTLDQPWAIFTS